MSNDSAHTHSRCPWLLLAVAVPADMLAALALSWWMPSLLNWVSPVSAVLTVLVLAAHSQRACRSYALILACCLAGSVSMLAVGLVSAHRVTVSHGIAATVGSVLVALYSLHQTIPRGAYLKDGDRVFPLALKSFFHDGCDERHWAAFAAEEPVLFEETSHMELVVAHNPSDIPIQVMIAKDPWGQARCPSIHQIRGMAPAAWLDELDAVTP